MENDVRLAVEGDLGRVWELERGCETAPHWGLGEYQRILIGEGAAEGLVRRCLLVADGADGVIGFAVGKVAGELAELESVAVAEGARRRGVGAALCRAVMDWCRDEGAEEMELEVRAESAGARRLYAALGFAEIGMRAGYYERPKEDAVLMRAGLTGNGRLSDV
jgi:ribosomal-protein-alanine N-acetyltransferase